MIRKPSAEDFREGTAVTVLRESRKIAVEGSKGVGSGVAKIYGYWFVGMMGFGFVMTMLSNLGSGGGTVLLVVAVVAFAIYRAKRSGRGPVGAPPILSRRMPDFEEAEPYRPAPAPGARQVSQTGRLHLEISALTRQAVILLVAAAFLILLGGTGATLPIMLAGIVLGAVALLLAARIFSDRLVMRYDARSISVTGLLGSSDMLWVDVEDISARTFSRLNLKVLFTSGARRNIVVSAPRNSLGGPSELLIPVDLIGLDKEALITLVSNLICCRAAGGEVVPGWQAEPQHGAPLPARAPTPAGDPRESFDPDAIMARHLAEREQLIAGTRPDLQTGAAAPPRVFGRKRA